MNCRACEYWAPSTSSSDIGPCMRHAPTSVVIPKTGEMVGAFPMTPGHMKACGDFAPRGSIDYLREVIP